MKARFSNSKKIGTRFTYCNTHFTAVAWNWTCNRSEVCLYNARNLEQGSFIYLSPIFCAITVTHFTFKYIIKPTNIIIICFKQKLNTEKCITFLVFTSGPLYIFLEIGTIWYNIPFTWKNYNISWNRGLVMTKSFSFSPSQNACIFPSFERLFSEDIKSQTDNFCIFQHFQSASHWFLACFASHEKLVKIFITRNVSFFNLAIFKICFQLPDDEVSRFFFTLILFQICWATWICGFMFLNKFRNFWSLFLPQFFAPISLSPLLLYLQLHKC